MDRRKEHPAPPSPPRSPHKHSQPPSRSPGRDTQPSCRASEPPDPPPELAQKRQLSALLRPRSPQPLARPPGAACPEPGEGSTEPPRCCSDEPSPGSPVRSMYSAKSLSPLPERHSTS